MSEDIVKKWRSKIDDIMDIVRDASDVEVEVTGYHEYDTSIRLSPKGEKAMAELLQGVAGDADDVRD